MKRTFPVMEGKKTSNSSDEEELNDLHVLNRIANRKKMKSGGFQSMGLSNPVFKGIMFKGYKIPTPIQRKTIPIIMDGKDVVAMSRTGSGKTGAFVIPILEGLKSHDPTGIRAVVLSPTRELALQTYKFFKEIGKFTKLRLALILGGDKIEDQFAALHENPDIIIATPGRLMHILSEMNLKLAKVKYVVFDEADRLFEMGFQEQLNGILSSLPENRQTLLFSATLPKMLVEFASAGLSSPELIRLDVDSKLSELLKLHFLECRSADKTSVLLHLLRHVIKPSEPTVIFACTKHHVEYLNMVLSKAGYRCSISYSSLDPTARNINVDKFRNRYTNVFIVTDLAARGIDIPLLDNVINYNFPAKPKLFLHRVGRVARAGRSGSAYSIVCAEEKPFVLDLFMFLGRPINFAKESFEDSKDMEDVYGLVPQCVIDDEGERLKTWNEAVDFSNMLRVTSNAYKHYLKTRTPPSSESIKRVKATAKDSIGYHPLFGSQASNMESAREKLLNALKSYKSQSLKSQNSAIQVRPNLKPSTPIKSKTNSEESDDVPHKKAKIVKNEFYLDYTTKDYKSEQGLSLESGFKEEASKMMLDIGGDDNEQMKVQKNRMVWDRKKKKFVREGDGKMKKNFKNESGKKISEKSSKKKELYKMWLEKKKVKHAEDDDDGDENNDGGGGRSSSHHNSKHQWQSRNNKFNHYKNSRLENNRDEGNKFKKNNLNNKGHKTPFKQHQQQQQQQQTQNQKKRPRPELKRKEQILKNRQKAHKVKAFQNKQAQKRMKRKKGRK